MCVWVWVGIKSEDPLSTAYIPSIFGDNVSASRQQRYAAVNRRRQKRNEGEQRMEEVAEKTDEPAECSMMLFDESQHILEKYKALEADNCARISDLAVMKEKCLSGRIFPSELLLKEDNKLTSVYTGMLCYSVLIAVFNLVEK